MRQLELFESLPSEYIRTDDFEMVEEFLREVPETYQSYYSLEEVMEKLESGEFACWVYIKNDEPQFVAVFSFPRYGNDIQAIKIELMTGKNVWQYQKVLDYLADYAEQTGFNLLEAITHPTLAKLAKRRGFEAPCTYICKVLGKRN